MKMEDSKLDLWDLEMNSKAFLRNLDCSCNW
ncbi:hypothetical protein X953_01680 [Virgibacillus sp. SK37]|nr:hypothetical protein X953_01680 [Virgibacillus sp. SK37]